MSVYEGLSESKQFVFPAGALAAVLILVNLWVTDGYSQRAVEQSTRRVVTGADLSVSELAKRMRTLVVSVLSVGEKGEILSRGTGFFLTKSSIVTNRHVIEAAKLVRLRTSTGAELNVASVIGSSDAVDLAILRVAPLDSPMTPPRLLDSLPTEGEQVFVLGNPQGLEWSLSSGLVSAIRREDEGTYIQISAPISPGSSGSPVFNAKGEIIGVATASLLSGQNLNFAIPAFEIHKLPTDNELSVGAFSSRIVAMRRSKSEETRIEARKINRQDLTMLELCSLKVPLYTKAIELDPQNAKAWYDLSSCLKIQKKFTEAIQAAKNAIGLAEDKNVVIDETEWYEPKFREAVMFMSHRMLGEIYLEVREPNLARKQLSIVRVLLRFSRNDPMWEYWVEDLERQIETYSRR